MKKINFILQMQLSPHSYLVFFDDILFMTEGAATYI